MEAAFCQTVFLERSLAVQLRNGALLVPGGGLRNLRKTARGASSPAKPALHIPELSIVSSHPSGLHLSCGPCRGLLWLFDVVGDANADSPSTTGMAGVRCRGGMVSPIVNDESCDFLCIEKQPLAELFEMFARRQGIAGGDAGAVGSAAYLPC